MVCGVLYLQPSYFYGSIFKIEKFRGFRIYKILKYCYNSLDVLAIELRDIQLILVDDRLKNGNHMLKKLIKKMLKKVKGKIYSPSHFYTKFCKDALDEDLILLEAGQGKNINGNMFAMLCEICNNTLWKDLNPVFVVTKGKKSAARERFDLYGLHPRIVIRNSEGYCHVLATAKYLLTDNSFPPFFHKRDGQIYLNTWHGTPLKTLGKSDIYNAKSLANIQKNYLMSDYALFPNEFTRDIFMKDYMLENIYQGKNILCDYPRNSTLLDRTSADKRRKELGLENKQLIAYMPTWRGTGRNASVGRQKKILDRYFQEIDKRLQDDQIFYVNLHFLLGNVMDLSGFQHIRFFPEEYETYDFLAVCDVLVTDYSSVFFDFASPEKKIVLFPYDLEEYIQERGVYFSLEELPFPVVMDVEALIGELNDRESKISIAGFLDKYCAYRDYNVPEKVMRLMVHKDERQLDIQDAPSDGKDYVLVYVGELRTKRLHRKILDHICRLKDSTEDNIILCFSNSVTPSSAEFLEQLPEGVRYLNLLSGFEFPFIQRIMASLAIKSPFLTGIMDHRLERYYDHERRRLFYHLKPSRVVYYAGIPSYHYKILSCFSCMKEAYIFHDDLVGVSAAAGSYKAMLRFFVEHYDRVVDERDEDVGKYWTEEEREQCYNVSIQMRTVLKYFTSGKRGLGIRALALVTSVYPFPLSDVDVSIGDFRYPSNMGEGIRLGKYRRLTMISFEIPNRDLVHMKLSNRISFSYKNEEGYGFVQSLSYRFGRCRSNKRGRMHIIPDSDIVAYFRPSAKKNLCLVVRNRNLTDPRSEQIKLGLAYRLAKILGPLDAIILFEKDGSRYEESASVLYESLIDQGYRNAYFVIDRAYPYLDRIPPKYRPNLLYKTTWKHYIFFFRAKTFIGSEALVHSIDLRIDNKYAKKKLASKNIDYIFLQHGVMYMVSLDSESRTMFRPKAARGKFRVVVSSQEEARHFVELGGYDPSYLYVCGLPKYDRNVMVGSADKIVIMPTWRPWEFNEARYDFAQTKYYQMICRIFASIPERYRDDIIILPHPLFLDAVQNSEFELKKYLDRDSKYDDVLKKTKVLITDYSSIAYDAFYRGENVIFYWEEKDECLSYYGASTKLMLNEDNVFGDICYCQEDLKKIFEKNYTQKQDPRYVQNYRKIVEFRDGQNTQRLIGLLREDKII